MYSERRHTCLAYVPPRVPALVNSSSRERKGFITYLYLPLEMESARKKSAASASCLWKNPPWMHHGHPWRSHWAPHCSAASVGHRRAGQGSSGVLSQTRSRATRNPHSLISSIYFYSNLQNYRLYFAFIWESLCSLQTFTHPIWDQCFQAFFTDMECSWINITAKTFASRFPSPCHHILPSLPV